MAALAKLRRDLVAILPIAKLQKPALAALAGCVDTAEAMAHLQSRGDPMSAARLGAFALPRREAVWWASMCVTHTAPANQPHVEIRAREAAELWVRQQDDETRRRAMVLAERAGFDAPEAWVAVAAFWSGESISPLGQPAVPPSPHWAGKAVAGAVSLAAVREDPAQRPARLNRFLDSLRDIADGGAGRLPRDGVSHAR